MVKPVHEIKTEKAPAAIGPYSQAIVVNGMVYTSGQIPLDPVTGDIVGTEITEQSEQSIKNIISILEAEGLSLSNVVKVTCFLADMNDFAAFNEVYTKHFTSKPARSCVAVKGLPKGVLVEIEVIAVMNK